MKDLQEEDFLSFGSTVQHCAQTSTTSVRLKSGDSFFSCIVAKWLWRKKIVAAPYVVVVEWTYLDISAGWNSVHPLLLLLLLLTLGLVISEEQLHTAAHLDHFLQRRRNRKVADSPNPNSIGSVRRLSFACGDLSGSNLLCPLFASPLMYLWGTGPISNYWPGLLSPLQGRPLPVYFVFCLGSLPTLLCFSSAVQPSSSKALASFSLFWCWRLWKNRIE